MVIENNDKSSYLLPLITSLLGVFLLLTEDFGAWQDRSSFYGVTEGYVWIGSTKAAPWAQIVILILIGGLLFCAFVAWKGYQNPSNITPKMLRNAYRSATGVLVLTILFGLAFIALVYDSDWWWFGGGFYGALGGSALTAYLYRRTTQARSD